MLPLSTELSTIGSETFVYGTMTPETSRRLIISFTFIAAAAGLRLSHLEHQSLWNDEMFSFEVANLPVSDIQSSLAAHYHHPPLFFYLLHYVLEWFGRSAWALRLISAAAGAITVGLVFHCSSAMFGIPAGMLSAAICLVSPFHLAYSQEGRPYALAAFLALASFCSLSAVLKERKASAMILYAAATIALLYSHHWRIFVLAAQAVHVGLERDVGAAAKRPILLCWLLIAGLYVPELPVLRNQSAGGSSPGWFWVEGPSWRELYWLAGAFSGTFFKMASSIFVSQPVVRIAGAAAAAAAIILAAAYSIGDRGNRNLRAVLACLGGTLLIAFLVSYVRPEVFLWYRYTVVVFPLFCIATGAASVHPRWRILGLLAAVMLIVLGSLGSFRYYSWSKSNVRDVAVYADSLARTGPGILIRPQSFAPLLNYYYHGTAAQYDEAYLDKPLGGIVDTAAAFIYVSLDVPNEIRTYMDGHFLKTDERRFPGEAHMGMVVALYRQPPGNSRQ